MMLDTPNNSTPAPLLATDDAIVEVGGKRYMTDARGALVPVELVKPVDLLIDQTVRTIMGFAVELNAQIARFKGHTFDDVGTLQAILADQYKASVGGRKGNVTLTSFDGTQKVVIQVQDHLTFGPELQVAKGLVDDCVRAWSSDSRPEIRALIEHAFQTDREGRINRGALYTLRRVDIKDPDWQAAMQALTDSLRVIGTSTYIRFFRRPDGRAKWQPVTIDLASAELPAPEAVPS